jgi:hypothetical protein
MQLSQRTPNCIYNSRGYYPVGELASRNVPKSKTVQPLPLDIQLTNHGAAAQEPSLYVGPLVISACQQTGREFAH